VEDPEALRTIIKDFSDWGVSQAKEREKEILAGTTPAGAASTQPKAAKPNSAREWEAYLNTQPLGPERESAWKEYFR
jgi:hypothetical protein